MDASVKSPLPPRKVVKKRHASAACVTLTPAVAVAAAAAAAAAAPTPAVAATAAAAGLCAYTDANAYRTTDAELAERDRLSTPLLERLRHAAEAHRRVRAAMRPHIRPGVTTLSVVERLEATSRALLGADDGLVGGPAFPTGVSLNAVAAHDTPNPGDAPVVLRRDDVVKVDFGTHVAGRIIDSAWTVTWSARGRPLLAAVRAATEAGIAAAGIDARLSAVGGAIQEVMESHEVHLRGDGGGATRVRCVRNLGGHSIGPYRIHGGKIVPTVRGGGGRTRMEEGEVYAIETFGTTGRGVCAEVPHRTSHYMRASGGAAAAAAAAAGGWRRPKPRPRSAAAADLLATIDARHGTLAFCRRWLARAGAVDHGAALAELTADGTLDAYPPLADVAGALTAQFEHTLVLRPTCKEVLSRGDDY
ncbi:hypothetical protein BU14_0255s0023 [Porphyra umbilicalis]|uniref:Methionine aminopeptidase 2 n=1 Tax=Porphyra umbilicalis TaxID=2786 RepID=A0A1X6P2W9_PORUM|nr:hypothetical protein BU14_0255s0023 [Porphyra umbilicalis]|eukprot:OSX75116.1 hypothetical protein BU14_0255s0023 [Porphyra umbilicalis]